MKALTLTQPWASLVADRWKSVETRSWYTSYRGPLAIHAAKTIPKWVESAVRREPFLAANYGPDEIYNLPRGMVIATARLVGVHPTHSALDRIHQMYRDRGLGQVDIHIELVLGDYSEDRYAWFLTDVVPLPEPIPAKGALGLWDWSDRQ